MPTINTTNILTEAVSRALERMAFLDVMDFEGACEAPAEMVFTEINFTGPLSGKIRAAAAMDFAKVLAGNISGLGALTEDHSCDAMKEFVNVTCGLVLPMIAQSELDVFDVTVPQVNRTMDSEQWRDFVDSDDVTILDVEDWPVAANMVIC
ncbi:MAG: chemotaxis protein CheX [Planctomycetota bacterium]|jgi:hypothetical protein